MQKVLQCTRVTKQSEYLWWLLSTMGMWASELGLVAVEKCCQIWCVPFSFTLRRQLCTCSWFTWGCDGIKMHCGMMIIQWMECDALGNVLMGNPGSGHSSGRKFGMLYLQWCYLVKEVSFNRIMHPATPHTLCRNGLRAWWRVEDVALASKFPRS